MAYTGGFQKISGQDVATKERVIGAVAYSAGDLLMRSTTAGTLIAGTSSITPNLMVGGGIVVEDTDGAQTWVKIQDIDYNAEYVVNAANTANTAHNYMCMTLTDKNTVNNSGTDDVANGIFMQTGVVGATTDQKIKGQFVRALS